MLMLFYYLVFLLVVSLSLLCLEAVVKFAFAAVLSGVGYFLQGMSELLLTFRFVVVLIEVYKRELVKNGC